MSAKQSDSVDPILRIEHEIFAKSLSRLFVRLRDFNKP